MYRWGVRSMTEAEYKRLIFNQGLNMRMLAEQLGTKGPYVSAFITGRGNIPRKDWQILQNYFAALRAAA